MEGIPAMKCASTSLLVVCLGFVLALPSTATAQVREDETVKESIGVLNDIMAIPAKGIPVGMFKDAHAVAIIPSVIKGSFIVGARHGNGVLLVRDDNGGWHAPVFVSLTGGNIGWQVGVQSTDVILIFKTRQSVSNLLSGKFTLGADAAVAAGPVGRQAAAATDGRLSAEIYSYSRSRGVFLGVSLDGSMISMDPVSNANYYRPATPQGPVVIPEAAQQLALQVMGYSGGDALVQTTDVNANLAQQQMVLAQQHSEEEAAHVRDQLARIAREMYRVLDPDWQNYLALPVEIFQGNGHPTIELLNECVGRYEVVRSDTRYASLAVLPEFQSTYGLLVHYAQELASTSQPLNLPAPPVTRVGQR